MSKTTSTMVGNFWQKRMIRAYSRMNALGILNHPLSQQVFRKFYFYYKSQVEDPFQRLIQEKPQLFKNGHILDAGANIGYTAWVFSRVVTPGFRVFAFEPEPRNFQQLQTVCREKQLASQLTPVQAAVGDQDTQVSLWINSVDQSDHRLITKQFKGDAGQPAASVDVPMLSLDRFVDSIDGPKSVAFIKLDIQGYEGPALEGMKRVLLNNPKAVVAVEYCRSKIEILGFDPDYIANFFKERGYSIYNLSRNEGVQPTTYESMETLAMKRGYIDLLFSKEAL